MLISRRVLAVRMNSRGFGFALFRGSDFLIDWGTSKARYVNKAWDCQCKVVRLLEKYRPEQLILEDPIARRPRRGARVVDLQLKLMKQAATLEVPYTEINQDQVHSLFGSTSRRKIAEILADRFPELAPHLPPQRKPWMAEDPRLSIFDAAALALAYDHYSKRRHNNRHLT